MTLTVGSPYLMNNGTSSLIDAQGTTPVVESPGYTLLPLHGVVEAMGGTLTWNATTQQIAITLNNETWTLTIGSTLAVNQYGQTKTLSVAPKLTEDGRTLVHIRALELLSGVTCTWNNATQQVYIAYTVTNEVPDPEEGPEGETLLILTNETGEDIDSVKWSAADSTSYSSNVMQAELLGEDEDVPDMEDGLKVYLYNESGVDDIAEAYLYPSGEDYDDYDDLVYEEHDESTLAEGDYLSFTLDASDDDHLWELYLVYDDEDETEAWVEDISLTGASDEVTIVVTDEDEAYRVLDDNTIELDEDASYDEITARIYNDWGSDYTITTIEASLADEDDWYTVSSSELEYEDYIEEDFDLYSDGTEWDFYVEVYNEDTDEYEDYYLYGVDFDDISDDYPYLYIEWYDSDEDDLNYSIL